MERKKLANSSWLASSEVLKSHFKTGFMLLLLSLQPTIPPALAEDLSPQEIVLNLGKKLSSITSLEANFSQYYYSTDVEEPVAGQGRVFIRRPDRMRWEYSSPEKQIFLLKGKAFWLYFPDDKQLIKKEAEAEFQATEILGLLSGNFNLLDRYEAAASSFPTAQKNIYQIKLTPREPGQYAYLLLEIDRKTYLILKAILFEATGSKLEYHFSQFKLGRKLNDELFELKVPANCEIIEGKLAPDHKKTRDKLLT
ncbi:MAG: outer membrane lipoprotein carrier protein LolA [Acidobacteriota bacterium]|nr:outer membrane lipoprotein carrier protein LolA [Acidobacteriota bacterium]